VEPTPLPFNFVRYRVDLTWADVAWGFQHGWLDAASVVECAVAQLAGDDDASPTVVELAGLTRSDLTEVPFLLAKVVGAAGTEANPDSERKWLYLVLAWLYDRRAELSDPLGVVEQLYADFGYPAELRGFVRYMPPEGHYEPQAHTHAENIARLFSKWKEYLDSFAAAP
jgi:hypothetical protein